MAENAPRLPRKLWLLWYQGRSEAPDLVRKCIDSWRHWNPTWDAVVLDSGNLNEHVRLDMPERIVKRLSLAHQSDLVRLALLAKHGGVWADATTICMRPLDDWIDECTRSGFFAFHNPGRDRIMSNWFMASEQGSPLVAKLHGRLSAYYVENDFRKFNRSRILAIRFLSRLLNRSHRTTRFWFSPLVTKGLGVYPYFAFHYMFERLVAMDPECRAIWEDTRKVPARGPLINVRHGWYSPLTDAIRREFDERQIPMYKLSWKYDEDKCTSSTWFIQLLNQWAPQGLADPRRRPAASMNAA